jgi:hypothetical protein
MNTRIRFVLGALAVAAPFWVALRAADPPTTQATGRVLLLENERIIEGEIERVGDQYRVRRPVGETTLPAERVMFVGDTLEEAYDFLRTRANLRDADERIKLARWCHLHGLREQALAEAKAAVQARPGNKAAQRLVQVLERASVPVEAPAKAESISEAAVTPAFEVSAESMGQFATKVQPILMNTCACCHQSGRAGAFKLTRTTEGSYLNRRGTQQNLAAVLAQINRDRLDASPLLLKAVSLHGEATQPPIKSRQTAAYKALEEWVRGTVANNPQLQASASPSLKVPAEADSSRGESLAGETVSAARPAVRASTPAASPSTAPKPVDPFDPSIFNQSAHPKGQ